MQRRRCRRRRRCAQRRGWRPAPKWAIRMGGRFGQVAPARLLAPRCLRQRSSVARRWGSPTSAAPRWERALTERTAARWRCLRRHPMAGSPPYMQQLHGRRRRPQRARRARFVRLVRCRATLATSIVADAIRGLRGRCRRAGRRHRHRRRRRRRRLRGCRRRERLWRRQLVCRRHGGMCRVGQARRRARRHDRHHRGRRRGALLLLPLLLVVLVVLVVLILGIAGSNATSHWRVH